MMNLKRDRDFKTTTYSIESDIYKNFKIDIVERSDRYDVWLYNDGTGIKDYTFGLPFCNKESSDIDGAINIILGNISRYILSYITDYMDE